MVDDDNYLIREKMCVDLYLDKSTPVCREERQYALFLNNSINRKDDKVIKLLDINGEIVDVFYEATIMRDFWFENKIEFNRALEKYANEKFEFKSKIGENESIHITKWKAAHYYTRYMMNAKPDIAVINYLNGYYYLNFIECKYKSQIGKYKYNKVTQIEIQLLILDFLCNYIGLKKKDFSGNFVNIEMGKVIKVKFDLIKKSEKPKGKDEFVIINLKDII